MKTRITKKNFVFSYLRSHLKRKPILDIFQEILGIDIKKYIPNDKVEVIALIFSLIEHTFGK